MRMRQLEYFVQICELGSFTKAAEHLNVAQPALGMQIKALEYELGAQLLQRTRRGSTPTDTGELVLGEFRDILGRVRSLKRKIREISNLSQRPVTLGLTPSLATMLTGRLLEALASETPKVRLMLVEDFSHGLMEGMARGEFDLTLAYGTLDRQHMRCESLLREALYFVTKPNPALEECGPIEFAELSQVSFVTTGEHDSVLRIVNDMMAGANRSISVRYEAKSMTVMKDLIRRGLACGILPLENLKRDVAEGTLMARPIVNPPITRTLFAISSRESAPDVQEVLNVIKRLLRSICAEDAQFSSL